MTRRPAIIASILALLLTACSGGGSSPSATAGARLTIFGAASLRGALEAARAAYQGTFPGAVLTIATDSSAALETQIEQGAPADVFLSADAANPKKLYDAGLTDGRPVTFARNTLVVVVPSDNPAGIASPLDLAKPGVEVIAAGNAVPITTYANQVVANLATEPGAPPDFAARYTANIVSREDNVEALVAKIELGEGDAGIVYRTDAKASSKVATVDIPESANVPATYDGVVVEGSAHPEAARVFLDWLVGPDGQAVLGRFGFLPPRP